MTQECRPAPGAENGSWHVLWRGGSPYVVNWLCSAYETWLLPNGTRLPAEGADLDYTYGQPLTPPSREMTREEMMEIAKDALGNGGAVFLEAILKTIARGIKP